MSDRAYYNEWDKGAAAWLRELIAAGEIMDGDVDERSIADVRPSDLAGYQRVHFFAGIGGWDRALTVAGWNGPVWTGSCPCQPFSSAGKRQGHADERHLWPEFFRLIRECRPDVVFGEQVESAVGHGWLDGVSTDLEAEGYAVGAVVLGAHSVGAPHIRQRLWWVGSRLLADADREQTDAAEQGQSVPRAGCPSCGGSGVFKSKRFGWCVCGDCWLADAQHPHARLRIESIEGQPGIGRTGPANDGTHGGLADASRRGLRADGRASGSTGHADERGAGSGNIPDAMREGLAAVGTIQAGIDAPNGGMVRWSRSRWHFCRDGKSRRVPLEPALFPLADGIPGRVGLLRGAGNAIVPQVAAAFIEAYLDARVDLANAAVEGAAK